MWLDEEGHRLGAMQEIPAVEAALAAPSRGERVELSGARGVIAAHLDEMKRLRLYCWDYSRLINVARWGCAAGYLSEAEAWQWIARAALVLRFEYRSWQDLGDDFMLGHRYWAGSEEIPDWLAKARDSMVEGKSSPWRRLPWDIDPAAFDELLG